MDKKNIFAYRSRKIRIKKLKETLMELESKEITTVKGMVKSSMKSYPYIQERTSVLILDPEEERRLKERIQRIRKEIITLQKTNDKIIEYISNIEDPLDKTVMEMYYTNDRKMGQKEIAIELDISRSYVSKIISKYC